MVMTEPHSTRTRGHAIPISSNMASQRSRSGTPFCQTHTGCPVNNLIPEFNNLVFTEQWKAAYTNLSSTNNFRQNNADHAYYVVTTLDGDTLTEGAFGFRF